jgi:chromosome segregation ATPase
MVKAARRFMSSILLASEIIFQFADGGLFPIGRTKAYQLKRVVHKDSEYTARSFRNPDGKSAIMALNAVEQVSEQVPADDFQALEEKIYRTIEMYKAARQALAAAERDALRARQQLDEREEQLTSLRRETVQLKKEREEIRGRVEKMLEQIESISEERAS